MSDDDEDNFSMGVTPVRRTRGATSTARLAAAGRGSVARPVGTSGRGLGLMSVARRGKAGKLSIVIVKEKEVDSVLCGGKVGSGGSMCVRPKRKCETATHKMKATFETANASPSGEYVVVAANGEAVYVSLIVPVEKFGNKLDTYLEESRTMMEWETILRSLKVAEDADLEEVIVSHEKVTSDALEREMTGALSPVKRMPREELDDIETDFDISSTFISVGGEAGDELREERAAITEMQGQLTSIVNQVVTLKTHPPKDLYQDLIAVRNLIGEHSEGMGPETIMQTLARLNTKLEGLLAIQLTSVEQKQLQVILTKHGSKLELLTKKICLKLGDHVRQELTPILDKVEDLETIVTEFASQSPGYLGRNTQVIELEEDPFHMGPSATRAASVQPQAGTTSESFQGHTQTPELIEATNQIKVLREEVAKLKEEFGDKPLTVGGVQFRSKQALQSWLILNVDGPEADLKVKSNDAYVCFIDASGLLALTFGGLGEESTLEREANVIKCDYMSPEEQSFQDAYKCSLPKVFGKVSLSKGTTIDSRVLPACKTYDDFESALSYESYKTSLENEVQHQAELLRDKAKDRLTETGYNVACVCINHSEAFITKLLSWMSVTYLGLCKQSGPTASKENWLYISHCVRAIFTGLYNKRRGGYAKESMHKVIWSCLETIPLEKEFLKANFSAHPTVAHVLNLHLQTSAVMKSQFEHELTEMKKAMAKMTIAVTNSEKKADKALTASGKK